MEFPRFAGSNSGSIAVAILTFITQFVIPTSELKTIPWVLFLGSFMRSFLVPELRREFFWGFFASTMKLKSTTLELVKMLPFLRRNSKNDKSQ